MAPYFVCENMAVARLSIKARGKEDLRGRLTAAEVADPYGRRPKHSEAPAGASSVQQSALLEDGLASGRNWPELSPATAQEAAYGHVSGLMQNPETAEEEYL